MKVYIQTNRKNEIMNDSFFKAFMGYKEMGFEIVFFSDINDVPRTNKEDIVVGYVDEVREYLSSFDIVAPELDYPEEINKYLGRRIWKSKLSHISNNPDTWPVFVKSVEDKKFKGVVVRNTGDLIGCGDYENNTDVWCSEIVNFVSEYRVYVYYGKIIGVSQYKGDFRKCYDPSVIENAVNDYKNCPNGYAMDFGVTRDGKTLLIEVNDGYSLGSYGLYYPLYAKLLSARWAELTGSEDECNF